MAQGRVKDLESLFHRSEAELAAALGDKRGLETEVAELRAQLAKVPSRLPSDAETLRWQPGQQAVPSAHCPMSPRQRTVTLWPRSSWRRRR